MFSYTEYVLSRYVIKHRLQTVKIYFFVLQDNEDLYDKQKILSIFNHEVTGSHTGS
jgi:hypothetical protein